MENLLTGNFSYNSKPEVFLPGCMKKGGVFFKFALMVSTSVPTIPEKT